MQLILRISIIVIIFCLCFNCSAQDSIPKLTGKVLISVKKGTIECDLTLSNIPRIADYLIRINSGLNIRHFKNVTGGNFIYYDRTMNDSLSSGESASYFFPGNGGKGKFLPKAIQFRYVGMYPVVTDTVNSYSIQDWKGNIAFNGYSVRADGRQSAWYPVLVDMKKDQVYEKVTYDIEVNCEDCTSLYINGSEPVSGKKARFKSSVARELTMFCGNYKIEKVAGTYFLNPDINTAQLKSFGELVNSYKKFYEKKTAIAYKDDITFIQTTPSSKDNSWLFVSYPTIVNIGYGNNGMRSFFDATSGDWFKPYMAHELGHYYFGSYKRFNAELGDMLSEGFAEFLSLKVAKNLISDSVYVGKINEKIRNMSNFKPVPFGKVKTPSDYNNRELYVYYYAPLVFSAIEKEIGEEKMWKWIQLILNTPTEFTNYAFLKQTLELAIADSAVARRIESEYLLADNTLSNVIDRLK